MGLVYECMGKKIENPMLESSSDMELEEKFASFFIEKNWENKKQSRSTTFVYSTDMTNTYITWKFYLTIGRWCK